MEDLKELSQGNEAPKNIIEKPANGIYYILWNKDKSKVVYDFLQSDQVLQSGLENIFQTENKEEFVSKLLQDFDINFIEQL